MFYIIGIDKYRNICKAIIYAQGPEVESLTIGRLGDITLLLIGNERPGTIAVYTIDERLPEIAPKFVTLFTGINKYNDTWENLYQNKEISMLDPEDIK